MRLASPLLARMFPCRDANLFRELGPVRSEIPLKVVFNFCRDPRIPDRLWLIEARPAVIGFGAEGLSGSVVACIAARPIWSPEKVRFWSFLKSTDWRWDLSLYIMAVLLMALCFSLLKCSCWRFLYFSLQSYKAYSIVLRIESLIPGKRPLVSLRADL